MKGFARIALVVLYCLPAGAEECYRLRPEPQTHHFVLLIDRSGSMAGEPLRQAIAGAQGFVEALRPGDQAAVVAFDERVEIVSSMTADRGALQRAIGGIAVGGATALYDAMAQAGALLTRRQGARIVLFLTDGADTGSRFTAAQVASLARSEGIFVYGIGLGKVDAAALGALTGKTGGGLQLTAASGSLAGLYREVLTGYYTKFGGPAAGGGMAVRSMPEGRPVRLGDEAVGMTPLKGDGLPAGDYLVKVEFEQGTWECRAPVKVGFRTLLDARQSDLGHDLWVVSRPHGAVVFVDGVYVGMTGVHPVPTQGEGWGQKVKADGRQLRVRQVPKGMRQVRLVALPEMDYGPEQQVVIDLEVNRGQRVLAVDILQGRATLDDGTKAQISRGQRLQELESELDEMFDF